MDRLRRGAGQSLGRGGDMNRASLALALLILTAVWAAAEEPSPGWTLISPLMTTDAYLIDLDESVVMTWHGADRPATIAYLLPDGSILRPCRAEGGQFASGGEGGRIQRIDAEDHVVWDFLFSTYEYQQHHDIEPMPNGHVLMIAYERKTLEEAVEAGRIGADGEMWPTLLVEVEPTGATEGEVVWEWHLWDHLIQDVDPEKQNYGVIADHPELLDVNAGHVPQGGGDWDHANAVDYHAELDQILISCRATSEIYIIDHSTTTEEAAGHTGGNRGHGGDFLYRWGNPQVYDRGDSTDQYFYAEHGGNWIDAGLPGEGNILVFNNGDRPELFNDYSTVDEIDPPMDDQGNYLLAPDSAFGPSAPAWTYGEPGEFYGGPTHCGAYRMPNGNTLICASRTHELFEVTEEGTLVWDYQVPEGRLSRAPRYAVPTSGGSWASGASRRTLPGLVVEPNPARGAIHLRCSDGFGAAGRIGIFDVTGARVREIHPPHAARELMIAPIGLAPGAYFLRLHAGGRVTTRRFLWAG